MGGAPTNVFLKKNTRGSLFFFWLSNFNQPFS
jgi:hypothetical protein